MQLGNSDSQPASHHASCHLRFSGHIQSPCFKKAVRVQHQRFLLLTYIHTCSLPDLFYNQRFSSRQKGHLMSMDWAYWKTTGSSLLADLRNIGHGSSSLAPGQSFIPIKQLMALYLAGRYQALSSLLSVAVQVESTSAPLHMAAYQKSVSVGI
ncbi:hypothetical protein O6H91_02G131300 [Diphasiastrum complanatum]|uniref:Uncharacterized protein n=1 Tax=Diphasiastrum complanatum TaxID=34168 RepID=A0ACC2EKS4_DIPCM|nr:hypothetical protein O6H91_02G131300 [Diphasiastrum complanatum]